MESVSLVTGLALLQFLYFGLKVGYARGKYDIKAPETSGHEIFERHYRVHYNTLEQLIVFVPSMWAFAYYLSPLWASGLGLVFIASRFYYEFTYVRNPDSRGPAVGLSSICVWVLLSGSLYGALVAMLGATT